MSLILADRFHPRLRREQQAAIDAGQIHKRDEVELLAPEQFRPLILYSLLLLFVGGIFFVALTIASLIWHLRTNTFTLYVTSIWPVLLWAGINIISYIVILPVHEIIHALAFMLWGGRPHFGARLPMVLYCGAREQLFRRNQYLVVGLAPLVVITIAGIVLTLLAPVAASYVLFATVGNVSGAAGDIWVVARLLRQPRHVLVEDTQIGYRVWEIPTDNSSVT
ncbi:MAG TPA: DUF3267 domain-containing protein [Ktedonobacteraceae bacterium]|nr:DUF3267 domain-containing protein [Ktedonobacteraceae bacterium]